MKQWWLPSQKGTQLWPRETVQPPKLVIEGVRTGTPLYRAVAERFAGRLKNFHTKAQRAYALSLNEIGKLRWEWGDGRAQYINIQGQEYLKLEVDHRVLEREKLRVEDFWDFAIIELFVPDMHYADGATTLAALAYLSTPIEARLDPTTTWPVNGLAPTFKTRDDRDPMINAAETDVFVHSTVYTEDGCYASFAVDLRPARGLSAVTVDIHAYIETFEQIPDPIFWTPAGQEVTSVPEGVGLVDGDYNQQMTDNPLGVAEGSLIGILGKLAKVLFTDVSGFFTGWNAYPGAINTLTYPSGATLTYTNLPEVTLDSDTGTYSFPSTGTDRYSEYMGGVVSNTHFDPVLGETVQDIDTDFEWWRNWRVTTLGPYNPYEGPDEIPSEVQLTLFKGIPNIDVGQYTSAHPFYRWDYLSIHPARVGHMTIGHPTVPTFSSANAPFVESPYQKYGVPKLGTVIINLRTDQGVAWQQEP